MAPVTWPRPRRWPSPSGEAGADASVVDHFRELVHPAFARVSHALYPWILRHAPFLWGLGYGLGDRLASESPLTFGMTHVGRERLARLLRRLAPDVVVTVHATPSAVMSSLREMGEPVPAHTTVVTDFVAHSQWMARHVDRYCVAAEEVKHEYMARGIAPQRIAVTGVPVAPSFERPLDPLEARHQLGLAADVPVVLAMAGSDGSLGRLPEATRALLAAPRPVQGLVVCGRDAALHARLRRLTEGTGIRTLGYARRRPAPDGRRGCPGDQGGGHDPGRGGRRRAAAHPLRVAAGAGAPERAVRRPGRDRLRRALAARAGPRPGARALLAEARRAHAAPHAQSPAAGREPPHRGPRPRTGVDPMRARIGGAVALGALGAWVGYAWLPHLRPRTEACAGARRPGASVALTFDDGPDPHWTPIVLEVLARQRVRATFFLVGERARRAPEVVRAIVDGRARDRQPWLVAPEPLALRSGPHAPRDPPGPRTSSPPSPVTRRASSGPPWGMVNAALPASLRACGERAVFWSLQPEGLRP